jgi:hypothetical protein
MHQCVCCNYTIENANIVRKKLNLYINSDITKNIIKYLRSPGDPSLYDTHNVSDVFSEKKPKPNPNQHTKVTYETYPDSFMNYHLLCKNCFNYFRKRSCTYFNWNEHKEGFHTKHLVSHFCFPCPNRKCTKYICMNKIDYIVLKNRQELLIELNEQKNDSNILVINANIPCFKK